MRRDQPGLYAGRRPGIYPGLARILFYPAACLRRLPPRKPDSLVGNVAAVLKGDIRQGLRGAASPPSLLPPPPGSEAPRGRVRKRAGCDCIFQRGGGGRRKSLRFPGIPMSEPRCEFFKDFFRGGRRAGGGGEGGVKNTVRPEGYNSPAFAACVAHSSKRE